jgi:hypothetical protein
VAPVLRENGNRSTRRCEAHDECADGASAAVLQFLEPREPLGACAAARRALDRFAIVS